MIASGVKQVTKLCRKLVKLVRNFKRTYLKQEIGNTITNKTQKIFLFRNLENFMGSSGNVPAQCMIVVKKGIKYSCTNKMEKEFKAFQWQDMK